MITEINIDLELAKSSDNLSYIADLPLMKKFDGKFTFKSGVNVIFGENGSGKSTLLNMLARGTFCNHYGETILNKRSMLENAFLKKVTKEEAESRNKYYSFLSVEPIFSLHHDGSVTYYRNPKFSFGSNEDSISTYHSDLFSVLKDEGVNHKGSSGNKNKFRMNKVNDILDGKMKPRSVAEIEYEPSDSYIRRDCEFTINQEYTKGNFEKGATTIILDEPESGLDILSKIKWFKDLDKKAKEQNLQIIMSSHSELVFLLDDVNFISADQEYFNECLKIVKSC